MSVTLYGTVEKWDDYFEAKMDSKVQGADVYYRIPDGLKVDVGDKVAITYKRINKK